MNKAELLQQIGNEVCEGCGPHSDCGVNPDECFRIQNAIRALDNYLGSTQLKHYVGESMMIKETEEINGEKIDIYYFDNPMFHEDWHKAEELGLGYIQYNHHGPDYWDDTLSFCAKDKVETVRQLLKH